MPDERKLFAVTEWVLRAGIIVTMLLMGLYRSGRGRHDLWARDFAPAARLDRALDRRHDDSG